MNLFKLKIVFGVLFLAVSAFASVNVPSVYAVTKDYLKFEIKNGAFIEIQSNKVRFDSNGYAKLFQVQDLTENGLIEKLCKPDTVQVNLVKNGVLVEKRVNCYVQ